MVKYVDNDNADKSLSIEFLHDKITFTFKPEFTSRGLKKNWQKVASLHWELNSHH